MKKLMFSFVAMAIMGAASYVALRSNNSDREFTVLELANIEALTNGEGSYEYPDGFAYTTTCNVAIGTTWWGGTRTCEVEVITCQGGGVGCNSKKCPAHPA